MKGSLEDRDRLEDKGAELSIRNKYRVLSLLAECGASDALIKAVQLVLEGGRNGGTGVWVTKKRGAEVAGLNEKTFGNNVKKWPVRTRMIGERLCYHEGDIERFVKSED